MSAVDAAAAVAVWGAIGLVLYTVGAYLLLLYLPPAERLPQGAVADAAFALTLPFVLALAWVASKRRLR